MLHYGATNATFYKVRGPKKLLCDCKQFTVSMWYIGLVIVLRPCGLASIIKASTESISIMGHMRTYGYHTAVDTPENMQCSMKNGAKSITFL
jgi:hypothetical protein